MSKILGLLIGILLILGGLNWGLIGLFNMNLVSMIFGVGTPLEKVVYLLVGLAAVLKLVCICKGNCGCCGCSCGSCCNKNKH